MGNVEMKVTIGRRNTALGAIPSVNLPAIVTCRQDAPCRRLCYACRGNFQFRNVRSAHSHNLNMWLLYPEFFEKSVYTAAFSARYFRWHSAGDIVDTPYLDMMVRIAYQLPSTRFLAFTKKFALVNAWLDEHGELPKNLNVIFSAWDRHFAVPNPYKLPIAYVTFKDPGLTPDIPRNAMACYKQTVRGGTCEQCVTRNGGGCWTLKHGEAVVFKQH